MAIVSLGSDVGTITSSGAVNVTTDDSATPLERFAKYIPGDIVGFYLAGFGLMMSYRDEDDPSKTRFADWSFSELAWLNYGVFFALVPIFVLGSHLLASNKDFKSALNDAKHLWWAVVSGIVAYTCWVIAIPETPFSGYGLYNEAFAGIVAMGGSALLSFLDRVIKRIDPLAVK